MLTVAQAAERVGRCPDTIRRWIRAGRLGARRVGHRYMIDEADLLALVQDHASADLPPEWERPESGEPQPDWARIIREGREERSAHFLEVLRTQR